MDVGHGGGHAGVVEQFLHRPDVTACLQHVRRNAVLQGVRRGRLGYLGRQQRPLERPLEGFGVQMVPAHLGTARIGRVLVLRKNPEPCPAVASPWVLARQCTLRRGSTGAASCDICRPYPRAP
jgi:hypothetical protein